MRKFTALTFKPNIHQALWGTESWEVSGFHSSPTVVQDGEFAGRTLEELAETYGKDFLGTLAPKSNSFPLLFKVIDAKKRLSVQVHPNEQTRRLTGGDPKTEMWSVLDGSGPIFAGLRPGTTPQMIRDDVKSGEFEETLVNHPAKTGLTLFIPGGLVHAIGENVVVYEVQQSSNTTYRLYDWGRVGSDGKPRPLHIEESLKSIDFSLPVPNARTEVRCPFFHFRPVYIEKEIEIAPSVKTFTVLFLVAERKSILVPANSAFSMEYTGKVFITTLN